eukprot:SAG31_NODE_29722_length_390_cov_17.625430_1_plen_52_part_10
MGRAGTTAVPGGTIGNRGGGNSRGSYAKFETQPGSGGDVTIRFGDLGGPGNF